MSKILLEEDTENLLKDFILTILTCGLWFLVMEFRHIDLLNRINKNDQYTLTKVVLYSILTLGIYYLFFQYHKVKAFQLYLEDEVDTAYLYASVGISFLGIPMFVSFYLQNMINYRFDKWQGM